jgi:thiosulfate/3-mercaptopyruvate sulfurtransferase
MSALISAAELKSLLGKPNVKVLDASYNQPPSAMGIEGALDFDIDAIADLSSPFTHTVPSAEVFAQKVGALGISNDDLIIVYDRAGIAMAAARAWWMFRLFGHDNVKILNGGLPGWLKAGNMPALKGHSPKPATFKAALRPELLKLKGDMLANVSDKTFAVVDARDSIRFGNGHIPGSVNTPYITLIGPTGELKPRDHIERIFQVAPVPVNENIACSCGSGVTACVIALALHELGHTNAAVYDGSWTEWGADPAMPKAQGQ